MQTVNMKINSKNNSYNIFIGKNAGKTIFEQIKILNPLKVLLVTNKTIFDIYKNLMSEIFSSADFEVKYCILDDGEQYKNQNSLDKILNSAFENKLERNDVFIAFGGGVIGDMTGFAASIYHRGVKFIQVPTTLLAQVDSAIGGKTGINNEYGKNLVGAFYQPSAVISDTSLLNTLPQREISSGFAEVVKYAFIEKSCQTNYSDFGKFLFDNAEQLLNLENPYIENAIKICSEMKTNVVMLDEKESSLRAILNFGHTIGHAIEKATKYTVFTHGEAIAIGMRAIFSIAKKLGKIDNEYFIFANSLLDKYNFNFKIPANISADQLIENIYYDKKVKNGHVRFVLPTGYATVEIVRDIDTTMILDILKELY